MATLAFAGTVLAEIAVGDSGIGYLMQTAGSQQQQRMTLTFAELVTIGAMVMAMYELFS